MNEQKPLDNLDYFISPSKLKISPDVIVIGTQETYTRDITKWAATIQKIVGSSYVLKAHRKLGKLCLVMFMRWELLSWSSISESAKLISNNYKILKTKGAIGLAVLIFGTSFLFITTHLTAHQTNIAKRINEIKNIVYLLDVPPKLPLKLKHKGMYN